jgi:uncharacterized protein
MSRAPSPNTRVEFRTLPSSTLAGERYLKIHRYGGDGARPKIYIQAALHSDELPAALAAQHLIQLLDRAAERGEITGQVIVVPLANPIGMGQMLNGSHIGQADLSSGRNFNRGWPDLSAGLEETVAGRLTSVASENLAVIREELGRKISTITVTSEFAWLQRELCMLAYDSDFVLDLHCDDDAILHLYTMPQFWPDLADLASDVEAKACLLCDDSHSHCFDETFSLPWTNLAKRTGSRFPVPFGCVTATLEFRGQADVSDSLAEIDAGGLFRFLMRRGAVAGEVAPARPIEIDVAMLDAADLVEAPAGGIIAYRVKPGDRVRKGDQIAYLVDPAAKDPESVRKEVIATVDGLVMSTRRRKLVALGDYIAMIVGKERLPHRQERLMTD